MAKKSKEADKDEVIVDVEEVYSKTEDFINTNQNLIMGVVGGVIAIIVAFYAYQRVYLEPLEEEAHGQMFAAEQYFQKDSFDLALNGDGNNYGFLEIIDEYSLSDAANLSRFYAGASYLKLGNYQNAIKYLNDFSSSDFLIQARAYSLIGDAYIELEDYDNAISFFKKASNENPNEFFTPSYLLKLALAYEKVGNLKSALNSYDEIIEDYKDSPEFQTSVKNKSRIEGLML